MFIPESRLQGAAKNLIFHFDFTKLAKIKCHYNSGKNVETFFNYHF